jgi:Transcription factor WhiB
MTSLRILDWSARAACKDADGDLFFPPDNERGNYRAIREAKAKRVCHTCPVTTQCRQEADDNGHVGIWGGTTDDERREGGVRNNTTSPERAARNQQMVTDLDKLTDDGFSRDEAAIYLRTGSGHIARILRAAGKLDVLERLDRKGKQIRLAPDKPKPGAPIEDDLVVEIKHLIALGHDIHAAADILARTPAAIDRALRRRNRHDLLQQLSRRRTA